MTVPEFPNIIETPKHFWYGSTDLASATDDETKVEKLPGGYVKITKSFIAKSYQFDNDNLYNFSEPIVSHKQSENS